MTAPRRRKKQYWFRWALLVVIVLLTIGSGWAAYLWYAVPADYRQYERFLSTQTPERLDLAAAEVDKAVTDHRVVAGVQTVTLKRRQINAWLTRRLPRFLRDRGSEFPLKIHNVMVTFDDQDFIFRGRFETTEYNKIVSVRVRIAFDQDGRMRLYLKSIHGGKLRLPLDVLTGLIRKNAETPEIQAAADQFEKLAEGQPIDPRFAVDEDNAMILIGVETKGDQVTLRFRLESRQPDSPGLP